MIFAQKTDEISVKNEDVHHYLKIQVTDLNQRCSSQRRLRRMVVVTAVQGWSHMDIVTCHV
jgi:hypothetical protein